MALPCFTGISEGCWSPFLVAVDIRVSVQPHTGHKNCCRTLYSPGRSCSYSSCITRSHTGAQLFPGTESGAAGKEEDAGVRLTLHEETRQQIPAPLVLPQLPVSAPGEVEGVKQKPLNCQGHRSCLLFPFLFLPVSLP